jgi:hypothetical protein
LKAAEKLGINTISKLLIFQFFLPYLYIRNFDESKLIWFFFSISPPLYFPKFNHHTEVGIYDIKPALEKVQAFLPDVDLSDIITIAKL